MIINILTFSFYPFHNTKLISGYTWGETAETRLQDKKKIKLLLDIFKNNKKNTIPSINPKNQSPFKFLCPSRVLSTKKLTCLILSSWMRRQ